MTFFMVIHIFHSKKQEKNKSSHFQLEGSFSVLRERQVGFNILSKHPFSLHPFFFAQIIKEENYPERSLNNQKPNIEMKSRKLEKRQ